MRLFHLPGPVRLSAACVLFLGALVSAKAQDDIERKVNDLLSAMTLEEKVGQLNLISHGPPLRWEEISQGKIGALLNFNSAADVARAQALARQSRLKIPPLFGLDILHGFRTQFPIPLGEAAAFSPRLSGVASEWAAREASYLGINWTFAPMADLSRDSRWGRIVEGFGEDPYLGAVLTAARVEGFRKGGLATSAKHFAGYGAPQGGRDYDTTYIPPAEMYDTYLPPFRAAVAAGSVSFMAAFNALNGVPSTANPWLLTEVLRNQWGFDGFVTSDWSGIHELTAHGVAADDAEAARKALLAGVDMDMMGELYVKHLPGEVRAGRVPESAVDEAVRRVLRAKFRLGLFDRPDANPIRSDAEFPSPETRQVAREVARETLVLLQNRNNVLPVAPSVRSIAVIGPLADAARDQLGPHAARGHAQDSVTILQGIRQRAQSAGIAVKYVPACDLFCRTTDQLPAALAAAQEADLVIAAFGEPQDLSGEAASRTRLAPSGKQVEVLEALVATGKPMALVIVAGRPLELGALAQKIPSILMAWYPGTEGGPAVADVLFGDTNPSGKLPLSWPRAVGQLPLYYNRLPTGRPTLHNNRFTLQYLDEAITPLYPFGWGLSYTTFAYKDAAIETPRLNAGDALKVSVTVTNTGARAGQEVVQLYTRDPVASRSRPLRELKAFEKIALEPGQSKRVSFQVPVESLGFHLDDGTYVAEAGAIQVFLGGNAEAEAVGETAIANTIRIPPSQQRASVSATRAQ
ncbi:glycoside hydrolase family 3 C-terminal domain-containing protein [Microvirga sp. BT350]|uniref:beta-glucosidase n=1 Tax=Microvirga alba TaxID=2791025 RepID=A0A931BS68_9HYPH|nr:glycoside hydrolase family 3 C-terminal domain-containing protein [Microvirga alba]